MGVRRVIQLYRLVEVVSECSVQSVMSRIAPGSVKSVNIRYSSGMAWAVRRVISFIDS